MRIKLHHSNAPGAETVVLGAGLVVGFELDSEALLQLVEGRPFEALRERIGRGPRSLG
jgi:hypothetical protein